MFASKRARRRNPSLRLAAGLLAAATAFAPLAAAAHEFKAGSIEIGHPWSRATPPGATTGGGYLKLSNAGTGDDRLVSAASPAAAQVQIHRMKVENGVMSMGKVEGVDIPAGGAVALEPGGYHLMLIGLKAPLKEGDKVPLTLTFAKAGTVEVWLAVDKLGAGAGDHDAHGDVAMDHMNHGAAASQ